MPNLRGVPRDQGFTLIELIVVVVVIGLLAVTGMKYYMDLLQESRRTSVEILSHRFTTATALVRAQWIMQGGPAQRKPGLVVDVEGINVYVTENGWPANTDGGNARSNTQTDAECYQIWQALLQNPPLATWHDSAPAANKLRQRFHISQVGQRACRYQLMMRTKATYYFDYHLTTGQVINQVPPINQTQ